MKKISDWQEIKVDFFKEYIFPRFWNHLGKTKKLIIEVQYIPALYCHEPNRRAFIGAGITLDFPYNQRKEDLKKILEKNVNDLKTFEKNHALGFVMTGDETYKIDSIIMAYHIQPSYDLFLQNFGENYKEGNREIIMFWYNLKKNGKLETRNMKPGPNSMIRVRYLELDYFMEIMKGYVENGFQGFPADFTKDDYKI